MKTIGIKGFLFPLMTMVLMLSVSLRSFAEESATTDYVSFETNVISVNPNTVSAERYDWADGIIRIQLRMKVPVSVNKECDAPAVMKYNGEPLGSPLYANGITIEGSNYPSAATKSIIKFRFSDNGASLDLKKGTYTLEIPKGFFEIEGNPTEAYSYTWEAASDLVFDGPLSFEEVLTGYISPIIPNEENPSFSPEKIWKDGIISVMFNLNFSVFKNEECTEPAILTFNGEPIGRPVYVEDILEDHLAVDSPDYPEYASEELLFTSEEDRFFPKKGTYTITIPEGMFVWGDRLISGYTHSWTIENDTPEPLPTPTIIPATGTISSQDIYEFVLIYPEDIQITGVSGQSGDICLIQDYKNTNKEYSYSAKFEGNKVFLACTEEILPVKSACSLIIKENVIMSDRRGNPEYKFDFELIPSSVNDLEADNAEIDVYTPAGVKVISKGQPDALNTLPAGIYIVNGRKIVIEKN